ncbi:MAG: kelch-like protein [Gammaproteobacteria bacterium]|nr:MAG: kelch-like protein [Gammaproteobacteria bacterium]
MTTGHWHLLPNTDTPKSHSPTVAYQGRIYVFGGGGDHFDSLNSTQIYDPATNTWSSGTPMPTRRSGSAYALIDGKIYIIGGMHKPKDGKFFFLKNMEIYDPETDSWSDGPDMNHLHDYPACTVLDGKIYVMGGHHPEATEGGPSTDPGFEVCERFDPKTGEWEEIAPLLTPRFALSAITYRGRIYTMGGVAFTPDGFLNFDHLECYDPEQNQWSRVEDIRLPYETAGQGSVRIGEKLYVFGGYSGDGICNRSHCYDFSTGEWTELEAMPDTRAAMGITVLDNTIYMIGGWPDYRRIPSDQAFCYQISA